MGDICGAFISRLSFKRVLGNWIFASLAANSYDFSRHPIVREVSCCGERTCRRPSEFTLHKTKESRMSVLSLNGPIKYQYQNYFKVVYGRSWYYQIQPSLVYSTPRLPWKSGLFVSLLEEVYLSASGLGPDTAACLKFTFLGEIWWMWWYRILKANFLVLASPPDSHGLQQTSSTCMIACKGCMSTASLSCPELTCTWFNLPSEVF